MNLLTIGDFYRKRFGKGVEIFCSVAIILSYLGWVAAQITALGLVFSVLSGGEISHITGMLIGTASVLVYVMVGGIVAVAWTDFIQMIVLVIGLAFIAVFAGELAGGADKVLALAHSKELVPVLPGAQLQRVALLHRRGHHDDARLHPPAGRLPARDVGQGRAVRVARRHDRRRVLHPFAFVPMFIVASALLIMPEQTQQLLAKTIRRRCCPR